MVFEPGDKVTCPKFDGNDGTVYTVVSITELKAVIQNGENKISVPPSWLVEVAS